MAFIFSCSSVFQQLKQMVMSKVEVHANDILFGIKQRNDLRSAKYLWPFNVLVYYLTFIQALTKYSPLPSLKRRSGLINKNR
jgi:hypothetical protein